MLRFEVLIVFLCISLTVCELVGPNSRKKEKVEDEEDAETDNKANAEYFKDLEAAAEFAKAMKNRDMHGEVSSADRGLLSFYYFHKIRNM